MDPKKVKAIVEWPTPKSMTEVRYFHGLDSFYIKFIKGFSSIFGHLTKAMRGDIKEFQLSTGVDKSLILLKQKVTEYPILALPDFNKVFQVDYDASGTKIGAVLSQEDRPVDYFSEKLNGGIFFYFYDQEFYAIVQALKKWRHYLLPKEFFYIMIIKLCNI